MNKEEESRKIFSVNLDRLISGKEILAIPEIDQDTQTALHFAGKMLTLRCTPTAEYSEQLKARLLQKLAQQQASSKVKPKLNWFNNIISQPIWQATIIIVLLAVIGVGVWRAGVFQFGGPPVITSTTTTGTTTITSTTTMFQSLIRAEGNTDKTSYVSGQIVNIGITLTNVTAQPVEIDKYPPILSLMQSQTNQPVYTLIADEMEKTLAPGETATYNASWNQRDESGNLVPAGNYYVELEDVNSQGQTIKLNLAKPIAFDIK